jgi:hypothetical protein
MSKQKTLITAALPYANGQIHVGHLAGAYLPADIYHRYLISTGANNNLIQSYQSNMAINELSYISFGQLSNTNNAVNLRFLYSNNGSMTDIGVIASNAASISIISNKIKNIGLYLPNLLQFHK